jgi:hypothetical protein
MKRAYLVFNGMAKANKPNDIEVNREKGKKEEGRMKKVLILWACLLPLMAVSVGTGRPLASRDLSGGQAEADLPPAPSTAPTLSRDFGKIPLYFVPNQGQIDGPVSFSIQGAGETIYFAPDRVTFALSYSTKPRDKREVRKLFPSLIQRHEEKIQKGVKRWAVKMDFVGARKDVKPEGLEETGTLISYFKGKPEEWKAGLPAYSKIRYRDLWPGIDLVYMGEVNKLKYEFIVHPGADPAQIRLACRGVERVEVTEEGRLRMTTPAGIFEDDIPVAYQEFEGNRKSIAMAYALEDRAEAERPEIVSPSKGFPEETPESQAYVYGFRVGEYDRSRTLVLDPTVIVYCGYIGGSSWDEGHDIAVDDSGNAYVSGSTYSDETTFPVKVGPDLVFNNDPDSFTDGFVAKIHSSGTSLVYCGYIGGAGEDSCSGIAVDSSGNAYVTGNTGSSEDTFPVKVGPDLTYNGDGDVYVAKINSSGTNLVYCGYIGGPSGEAWPWIAVDGSGNAYVSGTTENTQATFPVTVGPDLTFNGGGRDAFVAKVNSSGKALVYCGYIGGAGDDDAGEVAVDNSGNAYVIGSTESSASTFPAVVGPDLVHNGGRDAYVAKVKSSGKAFAYCGYIGGINEDIGLGIAVDGSGNAYVSGRTASKEASFPVKVGPDLSYNGGDLDAFVAKINSSGKALVYCGYIGGENYDVSHTMAVDESGNAYIMGITSSDESSFPVIGWPDMSDDGDSYPPYVAKVNSSGSSLVYCGYVGETSWGDICGVDIDSAGDAYFAGSTQSTEASFPVEVGPDLTFNGWIDAFALKVTTSSGFTMSASPPSATVTAGQSASYTVTVTPEEGAFNSSVSLSCSELPSKCTASFSPESVTPGANAVTSTLTLTTQASSAVGAMFGPIILVLSLWFSLRKHPYPKPLRRWLAAGALVFLIVLLAACGTKEDGGNQPGTGTPKGTYQITVKGESGDVTASTTVTLVVN